MGRDEGVVEVSGEVAEVGGEDLEVLSGRPVQSYLCVSKRGERKRGERERR